MKSRSQTYPRVTFIIPTLNAEEFLPRCLSAIRNQNYPEKRIEIIIADAGSTDQTNSIAKHYGAIVVHNKLLFPENGKDLGSKKASGDILFFTDSDNVLADNKWIKNMVLPYMKHKGVMGFLPQTTSPSDSHPLNRYLGYLFTEPFTWFVYGKSANPLNYKDIYTPLNTSGNYQLFKFPETNYPLFGLAQGVGTTKKFRRNTSGVADDMLSGIQLIREGGIVAYVPDAKVYHYHVDGFGKFIRKYTWRVRNNLQQQVSGAGIVHRVKHFSATRKLRIVLFIPYSFSILFPLIDAITLSIKYRDLVMLLHVPASFIMAKIILTEYIRHAIGMRFKIGHYV